MIKIRKNGILLSYACERRKKKKKDDIMEIFKFGFLNFIKGYRKFYIRYSIRIAKVRGRFQTIF